MNDILPIAAAAVSTGLVSWIALRVEVTRLASRLEDYDRRILALERNVVAYVPKGECLIMERSVERAMTGIEARIEKIDGRLSSVEDAVVRLVQLAEDQRGGR